MNLRKISLFLQAAAEPMQVDAAPEENDNIEDVQYTVDATTLVRIPSYVKRFNVCWSINCHKVQGWKLQSDLSNEIS